MYWIYPGVSLCVSVGVRASPLIQPASYLSAVLLSKCGAKFEVFWWNAFHVFVPTVFLRGRRKALLLRLSQLAAALSTPCMWDVQGTYLKCRNRTLTPSTSEAFAIMSCQCCSCIAKCLMCLPRCHKCIFYSHLYSLWPLLWKLRQADLSTNVCCKYLFPLWIPFCWLFDFSVNNLGNKIGLSQTPPNSSHCPINRLKLKVNTFIKTQTPHIFTAQILKQINKEMK